MLERELDSSDVAVAPLARSDASQGADAVLAGRFPDWQASAAVELVERAGGEVVADIDEKWTGLNSAMASVDTSPAKID